MDLAANANQVLSPLSQRHALDRYRELVLPQPKELQDLLLEVGQGIQGQAQSVGPMPEHRTGSAG